MKTKNLLKVVSLVTAFSFVYGQVVWAGPIVKDTSQEKSARKSALATEPVDKRFSPEQAKAILQEQEELNNIFDSVYGVIEADIDAKTPEELNATLNQAVTAKVAEFQDAKLARGEKVKYDLVPEGIRAVVIERDGGKTIAYLSIPFRNTVTNNLYTYIVRDKSVPLSQEDRDALEELPLMLDKSMPERNLSVEVRKIPATEEFKKLVALEMAKIEKDPAIPAEVKTSKVSFLKWLSIDMLAFIMLFTNAGNLAVAGRGEVLPEAPKAASVAVDAELQKMIDAVDLEIETLLAQPELLDSFVNMDKLLAARPDLGKTKDEVRATLVKELKNIIDGKTINMVYYDSFTVGNTLISHADPKSRTIEIGADMLKKTDPALAARVKLHELFHLLIGDPNHEVIGEEEALRDQLLSDIVTVSSAAEAVKGAVAGAVAGINKLLADKGLPSLDNVIGSMEKLPANKGKPAVIYVTVEPENNMIGLKEAVKKLQKENRQVKIILVGKEEYKWTADLRKKLKDVYGNIVVDFVPKAAFDAKVASVKDVDKAAVELAGEITKLKVDALDIGWISSVEEAYQVASGFKKIPVIQPREKAADQLYDIGTQIDLMELVIMAHRISGADLSAITFDKLADYLDPAVKKDFLGALEALGVKTTENVVQALMQMPPTTSVSGKIATDLHSLRSALTAA